MADGGGELIGVDITSGQHGPVSQHGSHADHSMHVTLGGADAAETVATQTAAIRLEVLEALPVPAGGAREEGDADSWSGPDALPCGPLSCLPLDVLAHVCSHVPGRDVWRLSCASRAVRLALLGAPGLCAAAAASSLGLRLPRPQAPAPPGACGPHKQQVPSNSAQQPKPPDVYLEAVAAHAILSGQLRRTALKPERKQLPDWAARSATAAVRAPWALPHRRHTADVSCAMQLAVTARELYWLGLGISIGEAG
jgi:hypothetical protein